MGNDVSKVKRVGNYIAALFKLGRTERMAKEAHRNMREIEERFNSWEIRERQLRNGIKQMVQSDTQALMARNAELARNFVELSRRLDQVLLTTRSDQAPFVQTDQPAPDESGIGAVMDSFYHKLENKYRGTTSDIRNRLRVYLPDVESAVIRTEGKPVMDIGCGRGEWLGLLNDAGITALGIDTNPVQIGDVQDKGLDARQGDARSALSAAEDNSVACITAHHLIEHLPFEEVLWITREAMRVLAPGGLLLFETPNVRNVLVGATSFHNDPTHLNPMTDPVLTVLFETVGFHPIETRHLHPHEKLAEFMAKPNFDPELANLMFGAQDLAILGHKPLQET